MSFIDTLRQRNEVFADASFGPGLTMLPSRKTVIIGCVDPRVDPADLFKLQPGEAVVIRNVGGRISGDTLETMGVLRTVAKTFGQEIGEGWNWVVLHHTDCGIINCKHANPDLLSRHFKVTLPELDAMEIEDPHKAVLVDIAKLRSNLNLPGDVTVTGMVYDVATRRVEVVAPSARLREKSN